MKYSSCATFFKQNIFSIMNLTEEQERATLCTGVEAVLKEDYITQIVKSAQLNDAA